MAFSSLNGASVHRLTELFLFFSWCLKRIPL
jgi:hypothetical protein